MRLKRDEKSEAAAAITSLGSGGCGAYEMTMKTDFDILIIGGGLTGQIAALGAAQIGCRVALIDARDLSVPKQDGRASALATSSMRMMSNLGIELEDQIQPVNDMLITEGDEDSPWKLHFDAENHGEPTAYLIENKGLSVAVYQTVMAAPEITIFDQAKITDWMFEPSGASVIFETGETLQGQLIVAADGRNSATRRAAAIAVSKKSYDQSALVTTIAHSEPHDGLALQRFLPGGPIAVLPLTGKRSQIVWSDKSEAIQAAVRLNEGNFLALLSERIGDYLGELSLTAPRQSYPLSLQTAERMSGTRLALIGDAAHVIHPLAGQGLNLGLRDVAALFDGVDSALTNGQDIGVAGLLDYGAWRNLDITMMNAATDGLSAIFGSRSKLLGHVRRAGMQLVQHNSLMKRAFMAEASGDLGQLPKLMQKT